MKRSGFTLLELLIGIALGVILLGIGAPSLVNLLNSNIAHQYAQHLLQHLNYARQQAIDNQQLMTVCLAVSDNNNGESCLDANTAGASRLIVFIDSSSDQILNANEQLLAASDPLPNNLTLNGNRQFTQFSPDGTAIGTHMTFQLCVSQQPMVNVTISPSGRSSIATDSLICP
ncbi:GspH/FimT family pseudopilin [Aeromonas cavernicola]|uniref:Type II secretion system protein H n=1 Tax=Aeromonas cavernicola TaxID=1006623 RepID=A0A2H9U5A2_9GAMM|nr:GspH/FimT family pseudopilin [Aeromonas cavernicola]PJG59201.1 pilus assembly protein [Aeromonas cavernicola]